MTAVSRNLFRLALMFVAAGFLATGVSPAFAQQEEDPPNILLIVSDDQGYNDLGVAGHERIRTPHLDQLAQEGVRLTQFYVAWPACTPSRSSFLTGRYPQRNGTYSLFRNYSPDYGNKMGPGEYSVSFERIGGMDTREILISDVLSEAGYTCGIFGKWDLGQLRRYLPLQRGFDDFYGFVSTGIDYWTHKRYGIPQMYRNNKPTEEDKGTYATDLFEREAERFIEENHEEPFFLYVPFNAPHGGSSLDPERRYIAQAPDEFKEMYPDMPQGERVKRESYGGYTEENLKRYRPIHRPDRQMQKLSYNACVTAMDYAVGDILEKLEAVGEAENTIVIFFSDNGGSGIADNTPLRGKKGQMLEGGLRVPAIVRWPGELPKGEVNDEFLTALELFPTLADIAGAERPDVTLDGFNMMPVLKGEEASPRDTLFSERRRGRRQMARVGDWKWVRGKGLFNLAEDMEEQNDLSEQHPEKLKMLKDRFEQWKQRMKNAEPRGPFKNF